MSQRRPVEWPTLIMMVCCYAVWAIGTTWLAAVWLPLAIVVTAVAVAQFSSLQHEVLHGHPFGNRRLNEALVFPALTLFVPFGRFRDTHLAHHHDEVLTDPYDDPESNYLDPVVWARLSRPVRAVLRLNNTLAGRMVLGPAVSIVSFVAADLTAMRAGDRGVMRAWMLHVPGLLLVAWWLFAIGQMPLWAYALAAYLGFGLLKIRTFAEHRAEERASARTVVIEDRGPLALLFLNNNLHVVHHMHPAVAWYRLPGLYRSNRDRYLTRNGGYIFSSYKDLFRLHFLHAKDPVPHPLRPGGA